MTALPDMSRLSPEMTGLLARVAAETGPQPDPTTLPPAEGRVLSEENNRRWNIDMPAMATVGEAWVDADAGLGSARVRVKVLVPPGSGSGAVVFVHGGGFHEQSAGRVPAAGALLFYGTYAGDFRTDSYRDFENGPGLTTAKMQRYWHWYVGDRDLSDDPLACPLVASDEALKALPSLYLMAAGVDPLLSDSIMLHQRLKSLGRVETLTVVPGVTHGFLQNTLDLAAAREALAATGAAARRMAAGN